MSSAKHSPGPWESKPNAGGWTNAIVADKYIIAHSDLERETQAANFALLAAAPDLLEALEAMTVVVHSIAHSLDPGVDANVEPHAKVLKMVDRALAAIKKARGS